MSFALIAASLVFIIGYVFIALEHKFHVSKSALALGMGGIIWLFAAIGGVEHLDDYIVHTGNDIFEIVVFLLAAMSLVEILIHYNFFDLVRDKLYSWNLSDRKQFLIISALAFILSSVLDNLTATIVMIQISRQFFTGRNLKIAVASIVINANAGGAWSPIGDVTTIMLWIANKFTAWEVIRLGLLPSLALGIVSTALLYRQLRIEDSPDVDTRPVTNIHRTEKLVIGMTFAAFSLPILMNIVFHLPPYLGLLIGLGAVWLVIDVIKQVRPHTTHLEANLERLIQKTDIASIKFFIGILLAVGGLHALGVLNRLSDLLFGADPDQFRIIAGSVGVGLISSILDNVPLAAISIQVLHTEIAAYWVLLAFTLGTGGSLLIIGSAAGVVAMGMVKELNFAEYFKIATVPALVGFVVGVGIWLLQYALIG